MTTTGKEDTCNAGSVNESMNYQPPETDDSFGNESTEDTLSSTLALRKNLSTAFEASALDMKPTSNSATVPPASQNLDNPPVGQSKQQAPVALPEDGKGLSVFLRIRPSKQESTVEIVDSKRIRTHPPISSQTHKSSRQGSESVKEFEFTQIMAETSSQLDVYNETAAPMIHNLVDRQKGIGQSGLLFSYGITNAGKTYTVLGNIAKKKESWGLVPRALSDILDRLPSNAQLSMSYLEIYNEQVLDLLPKETKSKSVARFTEPLKVSERNGQTFVKDLQNHHVANLQEGLDLIIEAKQRRVTASNNLNRGSSRSHSVCRFTVRNISTEHGRVETEDKCFDSPEAEVSLWIVDLAGSERSKKTGTSGDILRQKEAASINKSLMTLMRCLSALRGKNSQPKTVLPYRESKLTVLFMSHLTSSAAANTAMIVNIHPGSEEYDETQHVLQYAAASRNITVSDLKQVSKPSCASTAVEYGYNGRKKGGVANRVMGVLKRMSPKRMADNRKRKKYDSDQPVMPAINIPKSRVEANPKKLRSKEPCETKHTVHAQTANPSKGIQLLRMELAVARSEISSLSAQNQDIKNDMKAAETQIRFEVAEEMEGHMDQMRTQYEDTIKGLQLRLRQQPFSSIVPLDSHDGKIQELTSSIQECEDEMKRMREDHYLEMASLRTEHEKLIASKDADLSVALKSSANARELQQKAEETASLREKEIQQLHKEVARNHRRIAELVAQVADATRAKELVNATATDNRTENACLEDANDEAVSNDENTYKSFSIPKPATQSTEKLIYPLKEYRGNLERNESDSSDDSFGPSQWLMPRKKVKRDPKSGTFQRPRGRAPSGVSGWDERKGAWVVSS